MTDDEFEARHPHPDQCGVTSLFKFTKFDNNHPDRLEHLLLHGLLYHSLPAVFNDPWEAKPWVRLPQTRGELARVRHHLIKRAIEEGESKEEAPGIVSQTLPTFPVSKTAWCQL